MTIGRAIAVNVLLRALTNEGGISWEEMEAAGRMLADHAHKALASGHDGASFSRALANGQGFGREKTEKSATTPSTGRPTTNGSSGKKEIL